MAFAGRVGGLGYLDQGGGGGLGRVVEAAAGPVEPGCHRAGPDSTRCRQLVVAVPLDVFEDQNLPIVDVHRGD